MDLLRVKNLKDYREKLARHSTKVYATRNLSSITHIAVHHSLTKTGSAEIYARYHVNNSGWPGIGYHFVIEKDGMIKWANNLQTVSYHVGNSNRRSVGICLTGDFREQEPTHEQWESLFGLLKVLMHELNVSHDHVLGHSEFPGYESKACPCIDMVYVRNELIKPGVVEPQPPHDGVVLKDRKWLLETVSRFPHMSPGSIRKLNPTLPRLLVRPTPVAVKGPIFKVPDSLQHIIRAMETRGYKVNREGSKNYNLNIVGIRSAASQPGVFNERIVVFWNFEGRWHHREYKATTDPGLYFLNSAFSQARNIVLCAGQYMNAFRLGRKARPGKALIQAEPVTVIRDFRRSNLLFIRRSKQQSGFFDITLSAAGIAGMNTNKSKWPGASQLFANASEFEEFMKLCENSVLNWDNQFTYTLLNENEI